MPLNVVIAGAGIAGLATAIGLARHGHHVTVFEKRKYDDLEESGSSIVMQPNGMNIVKKWGMLDDLLKIGHDVEAAELRRHDTARITAVDYSTTKGGAYIGLRRDWRDVFRRAAIRHGASLQDGKKIVSVDSAGPTIFLDDGSTLNVDLIVGADGSFSKVRQSLYPSFRASIQPQCFYQVVLPIETVTSDPEMQSLLSGKRNVLWCSPERNIFSSPVLNRNVYDMQLCDMKAPLELDPEPDVRSGRMSDIEAVRKRFSDHHRSVRKALEVADSYWKWRLIEVRGVPSWSSQNGKVILVGDSVHGMSPYSGQGSAMGVEDGFVLSELFATSKPSDDLSKIARLYEQLRRPRCERVQKLAMLQGQAWSVVSPEQQARRDEVILSNANPDYDAVNPDSEASYASAAFRKWLNHYDIEAETRRAIQDVLSVRARI